MLARTKTPLARAVSTIASTNPGAFPPPQKDRSDIHALGSVGRKFFVYNARTNDGVKRETVMCVLGKGGHPIVHFSEAEFKDLMKNMGDIQKAMHSFDTPPGPRPKPPRLFPIVKKKKQN